MPFLRDDSQFPLVLVSPIGRPLDSEIVENFGFFEGLLARKQPLVVLFDARQSGGLNFGQRRMYIDWLSTHEAEVAKACRAVATVSGSPVVRAAVRVLFWVYPPPFPVLVGDDMEHAERWLRERLNRDASAPTTSPRAT